VSVEADAGDRNVGLRPPADSRKATSVPEHNDEDEEGKPRQ
jgi:hypothetical protein